MGHFRSGGGILFCHEALDELNRASTLRSRRTILSWRLKSVEGVAGEVGAAVLDAEEGGAVFGVTGRSDM